MYASGRRRAPRAAPLFEGRALVDAVRTISASLVKRAGVASRDTAYSGLLADIWGQSQYATLEVLYAKRARAAGATRRAALPPAPSVRAKGRKGSRPRDDADKRRREHDRDRLVTRLRRVVVDDSVAHEQRLTSVLSHAERVDVDALRRLWGVPQVVFEATDFAAHIAAMTNPSVQIPAFHSAHVASTAPDTRVFNVLLWHERRANPHASAVSKSTVSRVVRLLLTKRRSPFFEKNMPAVIETVLYAIAPDAHITSYRLPALRGARFFQGLQAYEYSRSFSGALENLQLGRLNRLLKDVRAVRAIDADVPDESRSLSLRAVARYCTERDTLTDRALNALFHRYVRRGIRTDNPCMDQADFVRMYLSLVASGTDPGLTYWFAVLDQDGDGKVGPGDVAHFYTERKSESEKRNGIVLANAQCLWVRICAMCGVNPNTNGIGLGSLKSLGREDREFVMCALLVRRVDDGNLINVAATVETKTDSLNKPL